MSELVLRLGRKEGIPDIAYRGAKADPYKALVPEIRLYLEAASSLKGFLERYFEIARRYVSYRQYGFRAQGNDVLLYCDCIEDLHAFDWLAVLDWSQVMVLVALLRRVVGDDFQPEEITLQHFGAIPNLAREELPRTRIRSGAASTSVRLPRHLLACQLPFWKTNACETAPIFSNTDLPSQLREFIRAYLPEKCLSIEQAADMSCVSVRTLQRRLRYCGVAYSDLVDQVRFERSTELLRQTDLAIMEIASKTGFDDPSNFSRTFKRLAGRSPKAYRAAEKRRLFSIEC